MTDSETHDTNDELPEVPEVPGEDFRGEREPDEYWPQETPQAEKLHYKEIGSPWKMFVEDPLRGSTNILLFTVWLLCGGFASFYTEASVSVRATLMIVSAPCLYYLGWVPFNGGVIVRAKEILVLVVAAYMVAGGLFFFSSASVAVSYFLFTLFLGVSAWHIDDKVQTMGPKSYGVHRRDNQETGYVAPESVPVMGMGGNHDSIKEISQEVITTTEKISGRINGKIPADVVVAFHYVPDWKIWREHDGAWRNAFYMLKEGEIEAAILDAVNRLVRNLIGQIKKPEQMDRYVQAVNLFLRFKFSSDWVPHEQKEPARPEDVPAAEWWAAKHRLSQTKKKALKSVQLDFDSHRDEFKTDGEENAEAIFKFYNRNSVDLISLLEEAEVSRSWFERHYGVRLEGAAVVIQKLELPEELEKAMAATAVAQEHALASRVYDDVSNDSIEKKDIATGGGQVRVVRVRKGSDISPYTAAAAVHRDGGDS